MKKAFTLAEVMIVLTVIGVITAVVVPVASHLRPNKDIMKFKKAHETLYQVVNTLVSSDKYYKNGDLGVKPNGTPIYANFANAGGQTSNSMSDLKYFCNSFADMLSTKSVDCSTAKTGENSEYSFLGIKYIPEAPSWTKDINYVKERFDTFCSTKAVNVGPEIVTVDDIVYYQVNPAATFHLMWAPNDRLFRKHDGGLNIDNYYKLFCIDIDGFNKTTGSTNCDDEEDICPFGYGIRWDGKILNGKRADEWLEKSISDESN